MLGFRFLLVSQEMSWSRVACILVAIASVGFVAQADESGPGPAEARSELSDQPKNADSPALKFQDVLISGDKGPEMVVVRHGSFEMGDLHGIGDYNEHPAHTVELAASFAIARYETTFEEWDDCVADGGCGGYRPDDAGWGRGRRPVINVSWSHAKMYTEWLSKNTGHTYRLPSESEWEYAARAGTATKFSFGNDESRLCEFSNHADASSTFDWKNEACGDGTPHSTAVVGTYLPNRFGLHDVHGNVWEWVEDCWNVYYFGAPVDGSPWLSGECEKRTLRGGGWDNGAWDTRTATRGGLILSHTDVHYGFRVARSLTSEEM